MSFEAIRVSVDGGIGHIALNRPQLLNAINSVMERELMEAVAALEADQSVRVLLLSGAGRSFCAGYDLKETAANPVVGAAAWRERLQRHLRQMLAIWDCKKPSVCAVQGYALGGGCDLAMICDLTYASPDAFFGEPEVKFASGVVTQIMPWIVGMKKTKEMLLTGNDRLPAAEALAMGLITGVAADGPVLEHALTVAARLCKIDPLTLQLSKAAINSRYEGAGLREALAYNLELTTHIEASENPIREEFDRLRRGGGGLKDAISWRDKRAGSAG
ncbi:MAG TPA: enoyl-CoA hydratase/isomerase family protein [Candidatus Dormibacteraeota bacterium]|nr:enoyl-CoA hydratase/isomerase family protein [Candidatus Dormibacteraeota bacterium]